MKRKVFLIDSSVILSGKPLVLDGVMVTTPLVEKEFSPGGRSYRIFQFLLESGLEIRSPSKEMFKVVEEVAVKTGDIDRLSSTDKELLALAVELMREENKVIILTDDYAIQNIAAELGIEYRGMSQRGITKKFKWIWRCRGCGMVFTEKTTICPRCGSEVKHVLYRKKPLEKRDSR